MAEQADLMLDTEQNELSIARLLAAPPSDSPSTVFGLIERVALDPRADVLKLERVMAMYERLKKKEAEHAYELGQGSDPKKACPHQDRQEQIGPL